MTEKKQFEIIKAKRWVHGKGEYPSRIVLLKRFKPDGTIKEYTTHLEVDQNGVQAFYSGHYFEKLVTAKADFEKRNA